MDARRRDQAEEAVESKEGDRWSTSRRMENPPLFLIWDLGFGLLVSEPFQLSSSSTCESTGEESHCPSRAAKSSTALPRIFPTPHACGFVASAPACGRVVWCVCPLGRGARSPTCEADGLGLGSCGHACGRQFHAQLHSKSLLKKQKLHSKLREIPSQKESYANV